MSAAEPTPLPEGKGEKSNAEPGAPAARRAHFPPFPSGRGAGGVGLALAALVCVAGAVWYFAIRTPGPKDDLGRFQGTWQLAPDGRANRFPIVVRVTGDRWVYMVAEKEQKRYLLTLRPEASPKEIDLTQLGANDQPSAFVLRGIYTIEDGGAKIVAAPDPLPRPTAFDAPDGPPVWVLERP